METAPKIGQGKVSEREEGKGIVEEEEEKEGRENRKKRKRREKSNHTRSKIQENKYSARAEIRVRKENPEEHITL